MAQTFLNLAQGVTGTLPTSNYVQGGIKQADQWQLTANITGTNAVITANLSQRSGTVVGTGMSESSGIFTFPETGIYLIITRPQWSQVDASDNVFCSTWLTTDNSSYTRIDRPSFSNKTSSSTGEVVATGVSIVDITNTATHKIQFQTESMGTNTTLFGNASYTATSFSFTRLGDT